MEESLVVHLTPDTTLEVAESFKISISTKSTISELYSKIYAYLDSRNDGNKIFKISKIAHTIWGRSLPIDRYISSYFSGTKNDVYCILDCQLDKTKHVKPIAVLEPTPAVEVSKNEDDDYTQNDVDSIINNYSGKVKTITKYSYYESSNGKWVKALISVDNIKQHPKDKIDVIFGERTLDIFVKDYGSQKDQILHFGCRKLHRYVVPDECKWVIKSDGVQVSLKKKKQEDNWWSFFKAKATGEYDSDLEAERGDD